MTSAKMIHEYLMWKRDKDLYPPQWTPDEWAKDVLMSEGYARLNLIKDLLEHSDVDPIDFANEVHKIVYDPIEELFTKDDDNIRVVSEQPAQSVHTED